MPIMNDGESLLSTKEDTHVSQGIGAAGVTDGSEGLPQEPVPEELEAVVDASLRKECEKCGAPLQAYRYRGLDGWSHVEKGGCVQFEEDWDAWSLRWARDFGATGAGPAGPVLPYGFDGNGVALLRQKSPTGMDEITALESFHNGKCVWVWEAASKAIFLNSDGHLRVNGKGTVLSSAKCPVFLDFGPGFMNPDNSFESRVAYIIEHRLMKNDMLYLKVRWISHANLVKELNECPDKFFGSPGECPAATTSSEAVATIALAPPP